MLRAVIQQTLVDLVREDQNVLLDCDLRQALQSLAGKDAAGGIVGGHHHQGLGLVRDLGADLVQIHLVIILFLQQIRHRDRAQELRNIDIVHPDRIRDQDLIARIQDGHQRVKDCFGKTDCHKDVLCRVRDVILFVQFLGDLFPKPHVAQIGSVEDFSAVQAFLGCLLDVFRGIEIRAADLEMNDCLSLTLHGEGLFVDLSDPGKSDGTHLAADKITHTVFLRSADLSSLRLQFSVLKTRGCRIKEDVFRHLNTTAPVQGLIRSLHSRFRGYGPGCRTRSREHISRRPRPRQMPSREWSSRCPRPSHGSHARWC